MTVELTARAYISYTECMAMLLEHVMTPVPFTIADDQTVHEAHMRMVELKVRHLPVMRGTRLLGVVSQRDLAGLVASTAGHPSSLRVTDAMTTEPYAVSSKTPLSEVANTMAEKRYGCVIAVDDGDVQGIFTTVDGMRVLARLAEQAQPE